VLWVGVRELGPGSALTALAGAVEAAARAAGFDAETRPFRPHLTIARSGRSGRPRFPGGEFEGNAIVHAGELVLYRSELLPAGARYTRLDAFPLRGRSQLDRAEPGPGNRTR
jgi:2'-5' RNA ligase